MTKKSTILLPQMQKILTVLGENIRLARLRRNITTKLEAERAGIVLFYNRYSYETIYNKTF